MVDPDFDKLDEIDQNIVVWAALLHDISKRCRPTISGKDHIHPFMSGATTLKIFAKFGFINVPEEILENLIKLIEKSVQPITNLYPNWSARDDLCHEIHSHHLLDNIFEIFWS